MKIRVWKYGNNYYPQYRKWFVWRFIYRGMDSAVCFITQEKAIDFLQGDWQEFTKVVWKGTK
jgi:hypothetical protein